MEPAGPHRRRTLRVQQLRARQLVVQLDPRLRPTHRVLQAPQAAPRPRHQALQELQPLAEQVAHPHQHPLRS